MDHRRGRRVAPRLGRDRRGGRPRLIGRRTLARPPPGAARWPSSPEDAQYARPIVERTDLELVEAARGGDERALDALLRRHHPRIYAVCRRMTGNDADALDATQEALLAVVRGLPRFDGRAAFGTWCYRVAVNACLDELRRRRRRPDPGLPETEEPPARSGPPGLDATVADRLAIDAALAELSPEFRAAVVLRDVCDLDYAEIAEVLDIPPGTVRSRIARGRAALADRLAGNPGAPPERPTTRP